PYPEENHIQQCESDAYVWALEQEDGTLQYYFDVLNPQGLSAMAMAVIMAKAVNGKPIEEVAEINSDIVLKIFGRNISMGKGQGLMHLVGRVQGEAKRRLS
ncbi:MAG: SufE family protein, partial [Chloroflexota bacterium]